MNKQYIKPQTNRETYKVEQLLISTSVPEGDPINPSSSDSSVDLGGTEAKKSFFEENDDMDKIGY